MLWIKRNLFIAVGGAITILLWGIGIYYAWSSYQENKTIEFSYLKGNVSMGKQRIQFYETPKGFTRIWPVLLP